ncbi:MAG: ABC transporter permease, partial [Planctomycetota bacterium]
MVSRVLLRKLRRDIWSRKGSLLALVAIIAVGIACYVSMAAVYRDMDGSRRNYYAEYMLADFTVDLKRAPAWTVDSVAELPNVRSVRGRVSMPIMLDMPGVEEPLSGMALSLPEIRSPVLNNIKMLSGSYFTGESWREVILNDAFARARKIRPGDRIKVLLLDRQHELLVIGTAMSPEYIYLVPLGAGLAPDPSRFGILYVTERFARQSCDLEGAYNQIVGVVHDDSRTAVRNTLTFISEKLDPYGVTNTTPSWEQPSTAFLADELAGLKVSATITPAIFLAVAALVLNILMGRLVMQQRPIIGTLRALGYSRGAITRHFLAFGFVVGFLGGAAGLLLGVWLQGVFCDMYLQFFALPAIDARFHPDILIIGMAVAVIFSLVGTVRGVRVAARLEPAEAMRPPPPEKGTRVLPERIGFLWRRLPFRWKMILRAVFRNPFRSAVGIFATLISGAIVFMSFSMVDALDYMLSFQYEKVAHEDISISLRGPAGIRAMHELDSIGSISLAEPQL